MTYQQIGDKIVGCLPINLVFDEQPIHVALSVRLNDRLYWSGIVILTSAKIVFRKVLEFFVLFCKIGIFKSFKLQPLCISNKSPTPGVLIYSDNTPPVPVGKSQMTK